LILTQQPTRGDQLFIFVSWIPATRTAAMNDKSAAIRCLPCEVFTAIAEESAEIRNSPGHSHNTRCPKNQTVIPTASDILETADFIRTHGSFLWRVYPFHRRRGLSNC
jgi:hypothetical protein